MLRHMARFAALHRLRCAECTWLRCPVTVSARRIAGRQQVLQRL